MPLSDLKLKQAKPTDKPYKLADGNGLYAEHFNLRVCLWFKCL
jgi:hypothetical protein